MIQPLQRQEKHRIADLQPAAALRGGQQRAVVVKPARAQKTIQRRQIEFVKLAALRDLAQLGRRFAQPPAHNQSQAQREMGDGGRRRTPAPIGANSKPRRRDRFRSATGRDNTNRRKKTAPPTPTPDQKCRSRCRHARCEKRPRRDGAKRPCRSDSISNNRARPHTPPGNRGSPTPPQSCSDCGKRRQNHKPAWRRKQSQLRRPPKSKPLSRATSRKRFAATLPTPSTATPPALAAAAKGLGFPVFAPAGDIGVDFFFPIFIVFSLFG